MLVMNSGPDIELDEAVLFPFDKWTTPLRYRLRYGLVGAANPYRMHEKVLFSGGPEDPDGLGMHYYGTVLRVGDELRMWYGGKGDDSGQKGTRMCYAVSTDGINWESRILDWWSSMVAVPTTYCASTVSTPSAWSPSS